MLITELKDWETVRSLVKGKVFLITCNGCKEVYFPEENIRSLQKELTDSGAVTGCLTADCICSPELLQYRLEKHGAEVEAADGVLVFSCGVGIQTVADHLADKPVYSGCDTYALPGRQGLTPMEHDCRRCGQCYLNLTGGICPLSACSKSLLNGPCGGARKGMCEVDPEMECGWERIYRRLEKVGRLDALKGPVQLRDYAADL